MMEITANTSILIYLRTQLYEDNNLRLLKTISDYYTIIFSLSLFKYHPQIDRFMCTKCTIDKSNTLSNDPNINHCYLQIIIIIVKCFILYRMTDTLHGTFTVCCVFNIDTMKMIILYKSLCGTVD